MSESQPDREGSWRCAMDLTKFCPIEGCPASYGCAREKGWDPSQPSPFAPVADVAPSADLAYIAWTIIANVDWSQQTEEWRVAATRWRDQFHASLEDRPAQPTEPIGPVSCEHPVEQMQRGVLDPEATYCPTCSTLTFPDGRVEPVRIDSYRRTNR